MKINQIKSGVLLSYIQMGLGMAISILYTPIMLRLLGQSEYGLYNISSSVISYLSLFNFGFGSSYVRYYIRLKKDNENKKIKSLNGLYLLVFSVLGIVAFVAGIILALNCRIIFDKGLTESELSLIKILMIIMAFNMAESFPASVFVSYITANEKFVFQKLVNMIKTVFNPMITLVVLLLGYKSVGMTLVVTFFSLVTDGINIIYCIKKLEMKISFRDLEFKVFREIALFSGFIALNMIVDEINWNLDKFLLGRFRGSVATSVYAVGSNLNSYYRSISTSITSVFTPRVHGVVCENESKAPITELFVRVGRIQFIILSLIWSGFLFFGHRFIAIWAGKGYEDAYYITLVLLIPTTIPYIQGLGIEIQRAMNMHRFRSLAYSLMAILNVTLSIPLCILWGGFGCALGTSITLILANGFLMNWYYYKKMGLGIPYFWKQIFLECKGLIIPLIYGSIIRNYSNDCQLIIYVALIITYIMVYAESMYTFGMNDYERNLVNPLLRRLHIPMKGK